MVAQSRSVLLVERAHNPRVPHRMSCSVAATGLVTAAVNVKFSVSPPTGTRLVYSGRDYDTERFAGAAGETNRAARNPHRDGSACGEN